MTRRALITGASGQDGHYLADLLLAKQYEVHALVRHVTSRLHATDIDPRVVLHTGDLQDQQSLTRAVQASQPDEVYNLAAMSFVPASWHEPELTGDITGLGVARMLEAVRHAAPEARFYQASSSEQFGQVEEEPQTERTPFHPRSPYGVAKCYGHWITVNYRESYAMFACCGVLFNHESPLRGAQFVTRKIADAAVRIKRGEMDRLQLGDLDACRDWGYAGDYVEAMWLMLQQDKPDDYVIATGESHSVREFAERAFSLVGLDWQAYVERDAAMLRPAEVASLRGDASKARRELGWEPKVEFADLVKMMVDAETVR